MDKQMEQIYKELNEENKDVLNMIAKAVQIGQQNSTPQLQENK